MGTLIDYLESEYVDALSKLPKESSKITSELLEQYKEIVNTTLIQQFGLGKLVQFKDGGNITTIQNARLDTFSNEEDKICFNTPYDKKNRTQIYEKDFKQDRKREFQKDVPIYDGYTGRELNKDGRAHKDHIIAAATIHKNDEARLYMSDEQRGAMAVDKKNLTWAEGSMNQSKGEHDLMKWMESTSSQRPDLKNKNRFNIDETMANEKYETAKQYVDKSIKDSKKNYYVKNIKETGIKQGNQMAKRQAIGIFLFDLQNAFFSEMETFFKYFKTYETNTAKLKAFKEACQNVKKRALSFQSLKKVFVGYSEGFMSGFVSNLITVLINTFARTSKNIVRIITEGTSSLIQAIRIILFPPRGVTRKQAIYEGSKIIVAAVITAVGVTITEAFINYLTTVVPLAPFAYLIGGILGGILTGIVSVTVIYCMDNFISIVKKINVSMKETVYYTVVSVEQLKANYNTAIAEIDSDYEEVLTKIFAEYEELHLLTNSVYDLKLNSSDRFINSQKLASVLGIDERGILKTDKEIRDFFTQ